MIKASVLGAVIVSSLGMVLASPCAAMHGQSSVPVPAEAMPTGTWIADGDFTVAPMSAVRFCMDNADECRVKGPMGLVALDHDALSDLADVNRLVNRRISPDVAGAGHLKWSINTHFGDCNDYAVQKRHELLKRGWPSSALSLAVVFAPSGGHLILSVRTDHGDLVLDNLNQDIIPWNKTGYRFLKRQSAAQPNYWVEFGGRATSPGLEVASLKPGKAPEEMRGAQVAATAEMAGSFEVADAEAVGVFNMSSPARMSQEGTMSKERPVASPETQQSGNNDLRIEVAY